jgi:uncharacterized protein (TIGR02145 family)
MKKRNLALIAIGVSFSLGFLTGCSEKDEKTNQPPTCHITSPTDGQQIVKGETVTISADAGDSDGSISKVTFIIDNAEKGSSQNKPYTYDWETNSESLGTHFIKAVSDDNGGANSFDEISVEIIIGGGGGGCDAPVAAFTAGPTGGEAPLTVNFTDQSTNGPISWYWDFGDGNTGTEQNPTHIYNNEGTYTVSLIVSNANCADTVTVNDYITVINAGCPDTVTDIEGNKYTTIQIDSQCWMAENLKTGTYKNGTAIPYVSDNDSWTGLSTGAYVWPDNSSSWKDLYGALYNGYAVIDQNGLCPEGWHVPTNDDWIALKDFVGGVLSPYGDRLKSCRQVNSPVGGDCNTTEHPRWEDGYTVYGSYGTDNYGFSALPAGYRSGYNGNIYTPGHNGSWWSSTPTNNFLVSFSLNFSLSEIMLNANDINDGISVRCIKD